MKAVTKSINWTITIFFIGFFTLSCQQSETTSEHEKAIDKIFVDYDNIDKPGAAVAVVQNGALVFQKGYGSANLEYGIPVTSKTIFHVASVSKQFTVFALLLLAEEGKLSLDDPIQKYISEVPDFGQEITLRHLATHTSGLRDQWDLLNLAGWRWDDVITKEHILKLVSKQKELNFTPGEQYMYCNTGFTLLAEVVARVSGKTFAEFTKERIFKPLQMKNTQFYDDHTKIVKNRAYSYYPEFIGYQKSVLSYANVGATSLFTTVEDLSRWTMNFKDLKVGTADIIKQMNTLAVLNNGKTFGGAYGQFVGQYKGLLQIQHSGADAGYRSYLSRFPDQDFAVSVFSNSGSSNPVGLGLQVADLYLKDAFIEEPKSDIQQEKTITLNENELKAFEGHYWNAKDLYTRIINLKDSSLAYDRGNGYVTKLEPIAKNKFIMLDTPNPMSVAFVSKDGVDGLVVVENDEVAAEMDRYDPDDASKADLEPYLGDYYSEELSTTYTFIEKDSQLVATHARSPDIGLSSVKTDIFKAGGNIVVFTRDSENAIDGLKVSTGRVKNLDFRKQ